MECYCDYDDQAAVYNAKRVTAKKVHNCYECGKGAIRPGDQYERVSSLYDGKWSVSKTCPRCLALRDWVQAHVPCFCWYHGNMRDDAIETARSYNKQAPGFLFGTYRREVAIKRDVAKRRSTVYTS